MTYQRPMWLEWEREQWELLARSRTLREHRCLCTLFQAEAVRVAALEGEVAELRVKEARMQEQAEGLAQEKDKRQEAQRQVAALTEQVFPPLHLPKQMHPLQQLHILQKLHPIWKLYPL